jgi:uncharacterized membrane protein
VYQFRSHVRRIRVAHLIVNSARTWVKWASFSLSLVGLGISVYLTFTHYAGTAFLACSDAGVINCAAVTTSAQSMFLGVPVAVLGVVQYSVLSFLCSPWAWARTGVVLDRLRAGVVVLGMGFVLWLVSAELLIIDHICLWCTGVHVVSFLLMVVVLGSFASKQEEELK